MSEGWISIRPSHLQIDDGLQSVANKLEQFETRFARL